MRNVRLNPRAGWLAVLTIALVLLSALPAAAEADIPENVTVRNLSAILPERDETRWPLRFAFLPGNRLFAASDRLTLVDLDAMEILATAPLPESAAEGVDIYLSDQVQELETGFLWIVMNSKMDPANPEYIAFQFDDSLNLIREIPVSDSLQTGIPLLWHFMKFDFSSDAKEIYYLNGLDGLRRFSLTTGEDRPIYRTETTPDAALHTIDTLRLIDRGETIFFIGGTFDLDQNSPAHNVYGLMSPAGEILSIKDPAKLEKPFKLEGVSPVYRYLPQSSPVALFVPTDPIPENLMTYTPSPPKSVYAWNTKTDEIVEIPLPVSSEADFSILSEYGNYLASGMCEERGDGTAAFVARLYDTGSGEALSRIEISGLSECRGAQSAISEADRLIRAIYRENGVAYSVEIPF